MSDAVVPVRRVSPAEADDLVRREGYAHVDVRTVEEFEDGHPAGAYNVPFQHATDGAMVENPDFLHVMRAHFAPGACIVVGCRSGQRSLRAARALVGAGFTNVVDQRAGWAGVRSPFGEVKEKGWEAAGLSTANAAEAGRAYTDLRARCAC